MRNKKQALLSRGSCLVGKASMERTRCVTEENSEVAPGPSQTMQVMPAC